MTDEITGIALAVLRNRNAPFTFTATNEDLYNSAMFWLFTLGATYKDYLDFPDSIIIPDDIEDEEWALEVALQTMAAAYSQDIEYFEKVAEAINEMPDTGFLFQYSSVYMTLTMQMLEDLEEKTGVSYDELLDALVEKHRLNLLAGD